MAQMLHLAWIRPAFALLALAGLLSLTACGGGGGSVELGPGDGTPTPSVVTVFPPSQTIYPGSPASFTISGGIPPYRVFSSDSAILPVAPDSVLLKKKKNGQCTRYREAIHEFQGWIVVRRQSVTTDGVGVPLPAVDRAPAAAAGCGQEAASARTQIRTNPGGGEF